MELNVFYNLLLSFQASVLITYQVVSSMIIWYGNRELLRLGYLQNVLGKYYYVKPSAFTIPFYSLTVIPQYGYENYWLLPADHLIPHGLVRRLRGPAAP